MPWATHNQPASRTQTQHKRKTQVEHKRKTQNAKRKQNINATQTQHKHKTHGTRRAFSHAPQFPCLLDGAGQTPTLLAPSLRELSCCPANASNRTEGVALFLQVRQRNRQFSLPRKTEGLFYPHLRRLFGGEQALSWQSHGVALTTCELGNGILSVPFQGSRADAKQMRGKRRRKPSGQAARNAEADMLALR